MTYYSTEEVLFETEKFFIISQDESEEYSTVRMLYLQFKDTGEKHHIAGYSVDGVAGEHNWCQYNDNALVILYNNDYSPLSEPIIKELIYFPTFTFVTGNQNQLREVYKMLFPSKEDDKQYKPKQCVLTK